MNKKGFTLIELLAVIVILAIILLITTPLILGVIKDARKGAFQNSAYGIMTAAENKYMLNELKGNDGDFTSIYKNYILDKGSSLDYKGVNPKDGTIAVIKGKVGLAINDGTWCAKKEYRENKITLTKYDEETCKLSELPEIHDTEPPVITILGDNPLTINVGENYIEDGATALDNIDGDLTDQIIITGEININLIGTYYITYTVNDNAGNETNVKRTINVIDNIPPDISNITIEITNVTDNSFTILRNGDATDSGIGLADSPYIYQISSDNNNWNTKCITNLTTCNITGLNNNSTYYYRLCVEDKIGNENCFDSLTIKTGDPMYYYDKYQVTISYYNYRNPDSNFIYSFTTGDQSLSSGSQMVLAGTTSYGFNSTSGFYGAGSSITLFPSSISNGHIRYYARGNSVSQYKMIDKRTSGDIVYWKDEVYVKNSQYDTSYSRGAFLETITAPDGTFPFNGRHTDGFWYMRKELVN